MSALVGFIRGVDALNERIGRAVSWLTLGCVLTCFAVVVLRYAFDLGFPWLQELYVWQHAAVFMAGAGFVLSSWSIREASSTAGGMPAVFLLKSLLWVFCILLFLQGLALIARRALFLAGHALPESGTEGGTLGRS